MGVEFVARAPQFSSTHPQIENVYDVDARVFLLEGEMRRKRPTLVKSSDDRTDSKPSPVKLPGGTSRRPRGSSSEEATASAPAKQWSLDAGLKLPPVRDLAVPPAMSLAIITLWWRMRPSGLIHLLRGTEAEWQEATAELAQKASIRDTEAEDEDMWRKYTSELAVRAPREDDALIKLVELDPRYLATPLVVWKVMLWKLLVVRAMSHEEDKRSRDRVRKMAVNAKELLRRFADALAMPTTKGNRQWVHPDALLNLYERIVLELERAKPRLRSGADPARIRSRAGIEATEFEDLKKHPRRLREIAVAVVARLYGSIGVKRVRNLITEARKRDLEGFEGVPRTGGV